LADEYDNAWIALRATSTDETRSPMFLMREVVRRLFEFFAPDDEVMKYFDKIKYKEDIKRSHRVKFIVTKINPLGKDIFLAEERAEMSIRKIYDKLSYAHKPGKIDSEKSRGYLYQASTLIKFLLDSFLSDST